MSQQDLSRLDIAACVLFYLNLFDFVIETTYKASGPETDDFIDPIWEV